MPAAPDLQPLVAQCYEALADELEALDTTRWDVPSLCDGWRVREVVAHVTMPARYDEQTFMAELRDCDFDFTRLSNRIAARDAELSNAELVANLRDETLHRWTPPGGGVEGALNHVVIHGLDVTVPLGVPRSSPDAAVVHVLDQLTRGGGRANFGVDLGDGAFEATDVDWSFGRGSPARAPAGDLVLRFAGRSRGTT